MGEFGFALGAEGNDYKGSCGGAGAGISAVLPAVPIPELTTPRAPAPSTRVTASSVRAALRWWLAPLRWLRVPVEEVAMTLLLSLRFMSLVFEEVRGAGAWGGRYGGAVDVAAEGGGL